MRADESRLDGALHKCGVFAIPVTYEENSIMLTMSASPTPTFPAMSVPLSGMWASVAGVYGEAMRANTQQLLLSSASVIQEQMLHAFFTASQSCTEALAKNAMSVQQQSMKRFADANGKAVGMMGQAFVQAWTDSLQGTNRA
jgi:hypothetical protein